MQKKSGKRVFCMAFLHYNKSCGVLYKVTCLNVVGLIQGLGICGCALHMVTKRCDFIVYMYVLSSVPLDFNRLAEQVEECKINYNIMTEREYKISMMDDVYIVAACHKEMNAC